MISSQRGLTGYTRTRSCAFSAAARNRPPYCIRGVAPTIAIERGLSILWIDAICGSVQNSMTPPGKERGMWFVGSASPRPTNGDALGRYSCILAEAERLRRSLQADVGRGGLLKTTIEQVEIVQRGLAFSD